MARANYIRRTRYTPRKPVPFTERFWRFIAPMMDDRGCWEWYGNRTKDGYGTLELYGGGKIMAHRASWLIHYGEPSDQVLHRCDNTSCANPSHLFEGSQRDNVIDAIGKGRWTQLEAMALAKSKNRVNPPNIRKISARS